MRKYRFKLTPSYCFYKGIVIAKQKGSKIKFFVLEEKEKQKELMKNSFCGFVDYVRKQNDCPNEFFTNPESSFELLDKQKLYKLINRQYNLQNSEFVSSGIKRFKTVNLKNQFKKNNFRVKKLVPSMNFFAGKTNHA